MPGLELRLIVFLFRLPDPLPLPDGTFYTFQLEERIEGLPDIPLLPFPGGAAYPWDPGHDIVSVRFWKVSAPPRSFTFEVESVGEAVEKALPPEFHAEREQEESVASMDPELRPYATVAEAVTFLHGVDEDEALSAAFDRCLRKTADVVDAYRLYSLHPVRQVSHERLDPVVPYATRTLSGEWLPPLSLLVLHANIGGVFFPEELGGEELDALARYIFIGLRDHPLAPYADRRLNARVSLHADGEYAEAVIHVQTAAEVLLDATLALMLWEEQHDPEEAARTIFSEGLAKRVRTHYHARLRGQWNPEGRGAIATWSNKIARLRGRVVHGGYRPTRAEAIEALQAADVLEGFIRQRVAARRNQYPRTALLALGRPGLERESAWTLGIREFVEVARDEPDWLESFNTWRDKLNAARD